MKWSKHHRVGHSFGEKADETGNVLDHRAWVSKVKKKVTEAGFGFLKGPELMARAVTLHHEGYSELWPSDTVLKFEWHKSEDENMQDAEQGVKRSYRVDIINMRRQTEGTTEKGVPGLEGAVDEVSVSDAMRCHPHGWRWFAGVYEPIKLTRQVRECEMFLEWARAFFNLNTESADGSCHISRGGETLVWPDIQQFARVFAKQELEHHGHRLGHVHAGGRVQTLRSGEGTWDPRWGAPLWKEPGGEIAMTAGQGWAAVSAACRCVTVESARTEAVPMGITEVEWMLDTGAEIHCISRSTAECLNLEQMPTEELRELQTVAGKITCELKCLRSYTWGEIVVAVGPFEDNIISWRSLSGWWRLSMSHGGGFLRKIAVEDEDKTYTHPSKAARPPKGYQTGSRGKGKGQGHAEEAVPSSRRCGGIVSNFNSERDSQLRWSLSGRDETIMEQLPRWLVKRLAIRRILRSDGMNDDRLEYTALGREDCANLATEMIIVGVDEDLEVLVDRRTGQEVGVPSLNSFRQMKAKAGLIVASPFRVQGETIPSPIVDESSAQQIKETYLQMRNDQEDSDDEQTVVDEG